MDQEAKVENKSNKWLYAVVGIGALLLIGWLGKGYFMRSGVGVDVNKGFGGSTTYSNDQGQVTVGGNKLPDNWPSDAPKYPNANIQYSGSSNPRTGEKGAAVVFMTSDKIQSVIDFYKKELASKGWKVEQAVTMGASTILSSTKDTRTLGVYIVDAGNGQVSVTVSIGIPAS